MNSNGEFNCEGEVVVYFGGVYGKLDALNNLLLKKIKAIRVDTRKSFVERDFTDAQATLLLNQLRCLITSTKK